MLSRILFGEDYGLKLDLAHGLHSIVTDVEPAPDSEFRTAPSGEALAMVRRWDHTLASVARWIPYAPGTAEAPISGGVGWAEFWRYARGMRPFLFVPDVTFPDLWIPDCYLVEPLRGGGAQNVLLNRDFPFKIRTTSGLDFAVAFRGLFHHVGPTAKGATFLRDSVALGFGGNPRRYRSIPADGLVSSHRAHGEIGAIVNGFQDVNLVLKSSEIDPGLSEWNDGGGGGGWTMADAASMIEGQTAQHAINPNVSGSANISQLLGTLTGNLEAAMLIVENDDAIQTDFGIFDITAGTWVHRGRLTWATGVFDTPSGGGSGELLANEILASVGPNGGEVRRLVLNGAGTVSNTRRFYIYPSGTSQNGLSSYLHHAQLIERASTHSPIVTGAATATREADDLSIAWPWNPQAMWLYIKFVDIGVGNTDAKPGRLFAIEESGGAQFPRIILLRNATRQFRIFYSPVQGVNLTVADAIGAHGDLVELLGFLNADGSIGLTYARNGAADSTATPSASSSIEDHWVITRGHFGKRQVPNDNAGALLLLDFKAGPGVAVNTLALARSA